MMFGLCDAVRREMILQASVQTYRTYAASRSFLGKGVHFQAWHWDLYLTNLLAGAVVSVVVHSDDRCYRWSIHPPGHRRV